MVENLVLDPSEMSKGRRLVYDYGHIAANVASLARIPGAHMVRRQLQKGELGRALMIYAAVSALDKLDGTLARNSKRGPSKLGARLDDLSDKYIAAVVEKTLVEEKLMDPIDFYGRIARNVAMTVYQRPKYKREGFDISAVHAGKYSTVGIIAANALSMTEFVQNRPLLREPLQKGATLGSWASYHLSPKGWQERRKQKIKKERLAVTIFKTEDTL